MTAAELHGYIPDFHSPDCFKIRCTECDKEELYADRGNAVSAADGHAFSCGSTGVTPLAFKPRQIPFPEPDQQITVGYRCRETGNLRIEFGEVIETDFLYRKPTRLMLKTHIQSQQENRQIIARFDPNGFNGGSVRRKVSGRHKRIGVFRTLHTKALSASSWPDGTPMNLREQLAEECKTSITVEDTESAFNHPVEVSVNE